MVLALIFKVISPAINEGRAKKIKLCAIPKPKPTNNPPKTGAYMDVAGICHMADVFKTSVYKIDKTIKHSASKVTISFKDFLVQKNVADQMCDESWSMGSLIIKIINTPD